MKAAILALVLASCTDADWKQLDTYGIGGHVRCYSGGVMVYEGDSTGKVLTENGSDGWYFQDAKTKKLIRVSADCVVEN